MEDGPSFFSKAAFEKLAGISFSKLEDARNTW
jgi:hypothetical protein